WTLKAPAATIWSAAAETAAVQTAIHLSHKGPGYRASATASAVCLSPVKLSAQNHLTSELLRTLSRVAASKPTSWLSLQLYILSPLPTGHPPGFQPWWVRSSTRSYPRFNLPMGRSLRFGSMTRDSGALFRLAFATAPPHGLTLPHIITRRLILQKARGHFTSARRLITLPRLVGTRFQVLFHDPSPGHFSPFPHGTCALSVTREYLGLGGGPPGFTRDFSGPVLLGIPS